VKKESKLIILALALLVLALLAGCGKSSTEQAGGGILRRQAETVKPNEDDGAIYQATEDFILALVADDRQKVLSLLTADHRNTWVDNSFLFRADAKDHFDEAVVENLNYTVVTYVNNESTNHENTGMIIAVYDVVMKKEGAEIGRTKIQENLAFRKENSRWLISMDERGFLIKTQ